MRGDAERTVWYQIKFSETKFHHLQKIIFTENYLNFIKRTGTVQRAGTVQEGTMKNGGAGQPSLSEALKKLAFAPGQLKLVNSGMYTVKCANVALVDCVISTCRKKLRSH